MSETESTPIKNNDFKNNTLSSTSPNKKFSKSPSSPKMVGKDWEQRSLMSGTSMEKLNQAFKTFENSVGPG